jgi:hypothetical protein
MKQEIFAIFEFIFVDQFFNQIYGQNKVINFFVFKHCFDASLFTHNIF